MATFGALNSIKTVNIYIRNPGHIYGIVPFEELGSVLFSLLNH